MLPRKILDVAPESTHAIDQEQRGENRSQQTQ
jgi:hypothetical protein